MKPPKKQKLYNKNQDIAEGGYEAMVRATPEGEQSLFLHIGGLHCASCIERVEKLVGAFPGVCQARLNFSTGRLKILWRGVPDLANRIVHEIKGIGYTVSPEWQDDETKQADSENRFLLFNLALAGFAMGNVMLFSIGLWTTDSQTMGMATREFLHWISALIAIPAVLISGRPFFYSAFKVLRQGQTNMDVPISVALVLALSMSLFETWQKGEHVYFDSAVMLVFFLLVGRYLDFRARRLARSAATDLLGAQVVFANVLEGRHVRRVHIRDVREGMIILVQAGEKIPVDGEITHGESAVDTSLVSGETVPHWVKKGDGVFAGTLCMDGALKIRVCKTADHSMLAEIIKLMEKAEQGQARFVRIADKAARLYTPVVHILALLAFCFWTVVMGLVWQDALMIAVTVLIITCPCALGLAVPVVQVIATGLMMRRGILAKSGDVLERLADIDMVVFDKTGTLTQGRLALMGVYDHDMLQLAASLAAHSAHPFSRALCAAYGDGELLSLKKVHEVAGHGMEAQWKNKAVRLGRRDWCGVEVEIEKSDLVEVTLSIEGKAPVFFRFHDVLRADAAATVKRIKEMGIHVVLLSGDHDHIVRKIAAETGIDVYASGQTPIDKHDFVVAAQAKGHKVLMVGDGLNDAAVLAVADVSVAPGSAVDISQKAADLVFRGEVLAPVAFICSFGRIVQKLVKQNFALAVAYNCVAIPMAFAGYVTPMLAAVAMSSSSLVVIINSFRLRLYQ